MKHLIVFLSIIVTMLFFKYDYCFAENDSKPLYPIVNSESKKNLTPFPNKEWAWKIVRRNEFQDEGRILAENGLYEEALKKYKLAIDPALLNNEGEKSSALCAICKIYKYQGKFDEALKLIESSVLPMNPKKEEFVNMRLELIAMIKAHNTEDYKPIYDYISYIKNKYASLLPPKGYEAGFSSSRINDIIHLYDYLHDYDAGIAFMNEIIKYHTQHPSAAHRSANAKHVREYERVKQAWELDKQTGRHGHLQEVIKTSDIISW